MRKILFLICLLISATNIVNAADWRKISYKTYVDISTLSRNYQNGYVVAWVKELNPGDWQLKDGKKVWFTMSRIKAKCNERQMGILSLTYYDLSGKVIDTIEVPTSYILYSNIIPDTIGEIIYNSFCSFIY